MGIFFSGSAPALGQDDINEKKEHMAGIPPTIQIILILFIIATSPTYNTFSIDKLRIFPLS